MPEPAVIVWERRGDWADRLRHALGPSVAVREVRSQSECSSALAAAPASIVAIACDPAHGAAIVATLWEIEARYPAARSLVLAERDQAEYARWAFEAGARWFIMSSRQLAPVARFVRRHLAGVAVASPDAAGEVADPRQIVDDLFGRLPHADGALLARRSIERLAAMLPRPS